MSKPFARRTHVSGKLVARMERSEIRDKSGIRFADPVKHKLVSRARDWPYSSFHVYVRHGLLPADWAGDVEEPMMDFGERRG